MFLSRLICLLVLAAAFGAACNNTNQTTSVTPSTTPATASSTPDEFAATRVTYAKDCVSCHGTTGAGGPTKVDGKTIKVPALRSGHALEHSDKDFATQIEKGGEGMPSFEKKMTPKEIAEMIRFIRKEFQGK
jgi:mono/diheme cytochrome c family protein